MAHWWLSLGKVATLLNHGSFSIQSAQFHLLPECDLDVSNTGTDSRLKQAASDRISVRFNRSERILQFVSVGLTKSRCRGWPFQVQQGGGGRLDRPGTAATRLTLPPTLTAHKKVAKNYLNTTYQVDTVSNTPHRPRLGKARQPTLTPR